jgi:hypothetical protein
MGSISDNCQCSWCGSRAFSFCELKGEGVICRHPCFEIKVKQQGLYLQDVRERQLRTILLRLRPGDYFVAEGVIENIAAWIGPMDQSECKKITTLMSEAELAQLVLTGGLTQDEVNNIKENCVRYRMIWYEVPSFETSTTITDSQHYHLTYVDRRSLQQG